MAKKPKKATTAAKPPVPAPKAAVAAAAPTKSEARAAAPAASAATAESVAARAHQIWIAKGKPVPGSPLEDWLQAEREVGPRKT